MEENESNEPINTNEPTGAPVLDVQPPKDETGVEAPADQSDLADPLADEGADDSAPAADAITPVTDKPDDSKKEEALPATDNGAPDPVKQPELPAPKKHNGPILLIVVTVLVAAILAIVAIMAFSKKDESSTGQTPTPQPQAPAEEVTIETQVDEVTGAIDETLASFDETKDFSDSEISDGTLGL